MHATPDTIHTFIMRRKSTTSWKLSGVSSDLHTTMTPEGTKAHIMPADTVPFRPPTNSFEQVSPSECTSFKTPLKSSAFGYLWISAGRHVKPGRRNSWGIGAKSTTYFVAMKRHNLYFVLRIRLSEKRKAQHHTSFGLAETKSDSNM